MPTGPAVSAPSAVSARRASHPNPSAAASTWSSWAPAGNVRHSSRKASFQAPRTSSTFPASTAAAKGSARCRVLTLQRPAAGRGRRLLKRGGARVGPHRDLAPGPPPGREALREQQLALAGAPVDEADDGPAPPLGLELHRQHQRLVAQPL